MTQHTETLTVPVGATTGRIDFQHGKDYLQWIVWQVSVQTQPLRVNATVVVQRNGIYLTSSVAGGQSSAIGPPAWLLNASDVLSCLWTGVQAGDELIMNLLYEEVPPGTHGTGFGLV